MTQLKGADISDFQGQPDFDKLKEDLDFVLTKATQGVGFTARTLNRNKSEMRRVGLQHGFYHFAGGGDPIAEANYFVDQIGDYHKGELLMLDWEIQHEDPAQWCLQWLQHVEARTGTKPLIYMNSSAAHFSDWSPVVQNNNGLVIASYGIDDGSPHNAPDSAQWPYWAIWQYTSSGAVNGIVGNVDLDIFHGDATALARYGGADGASAPQPIPVPAAPANPENYTVQSGDSMSSIAQRFGMSLSALEAANPQIRNPSLIYPGEVLHIPNGHQPQRPFVSKSGEQERSPLKLSTKGEVAEFAEADQFVPGKTQYACGFFACAMALSMAPVGQTPKLTPQQLIDNAEQWYAQYDGNNLLTNTKGITAEQEYELLRQIGLQYQVTDEDINVVERWVEAGYPVLVSLEEIPVFDLELGRNPYTAFTPAGLHVILVTGVTSDGNILCRDSANCTNLNVPNTLRPGPRKYKASSIKIHGAIVVVPPWLPRPTSAVPPALPPQEISTMIDISNSWVNTYFTQVSTNPTRWQCKTTGKSLFAGILHGWQLMNGAPRLPIDDEVHYGKTAVYQRCESGIILYDPDKECDAPNGPWEPCYLLKLDSPLAKKLLCTESPTTVDSTKLISGLTQAAAAIAEAQSLLK